MAIAPWLAGPGGEPMVGFGVQRALAVLRIAGALLARSEPRSEHCREVLVLREVAFH